LISGFADEVGEVEFEASVADGAPAEVAEADDGRLVGGADVVGLSVLPVPPPPVHLASVRPEELAGDAAQVAPAKPESVCKNKTRSLHVSSTETLIY